MAKPTAKEKRYFDQVAEMPGGYKVTEHKFPYEWTLKGANFTKDKGTVFSCFACGGGSTMGYKLAGFDVIGCNEIDPKMIEVYKLNHNPTYAFLESITTFKDRDDLPEELFNLDILDGSPPCSSFSMAGNREKDWGKEKKFREGQAEQVLDTLFFDFIDLAERLQPKVVVAENVKGLLLGEARTYVTKILRAFDKAGYFVSYTLLDASKMGVPQRRERVFFHAIRKDLHNGQFADLFMTKPVIGLKFKEPKILIDEIIISDHGRPLHGKSLDRWKKRIKTDKYMGDIADREEGILSDFNTPIIHKGTVAPTLISRGCWVKYCSPFRFSNDEYLKVQSFPGDYSLPSMGAAYLCGMSVPPIMTAQIATRIHEQWLKEYK